MTKLLDKLNLPKDLKTLSQHELENLAQEIREKLLDIGDHCGGHLASNLGVVELTLALHAVLDSPKDKMVWDTSHQCYVHKILTGRLDQMYTIRQFKGLSGFAKISESEHDSFGAGHASTSLSAALGMAQARDIRKEDYTVVAIFGDSALSGGMAFEALNNIENLKAGSNFIGILNDNDMAISRPVGNMATYITNLRTSPFYNTAKTKFESIIEHIPKIGVPLKRKIEKMVDRIRDLVIDVKVGVIFEEFGFKYLGPIDGHNIPMVMAAIKYAKTYKGPIMIHLITTKGKGHTPAEEDPIKYHGVSPKAKPSATPLNPTTVVKKMKTFTQIFGNTAIELAEKNPNIAVITPAMQGGSGLNEYGEKFPDRFFDVGIAEEHAVTYCAGMARCNITPILAIYSTFLQRGYDQIIHDVCLQNLPVIFALDRAGIVGEDGDTHQGVFDYAYMLSIPNISILAPKDGTELREMLLWATTQKTPISIRYPKGEIPIQDGNITSPIATKKSEILLSHNKEKELDIVILAAGAMAWPAYEAGKLLNDQNINCSVINLRFIKPLDTETLTPIINKATYVLVIEEGCKTGGVSVYIKDTINHDHTTKTWLTIAIPDHFIEHGKVPQVRNLYGLNSEGIIEKVKTETPLLEKSISKNKNAS